MIVSKIMQTFNYHTNYVHVLETHQSNACTVFIRIEAPSLIETQPVFEGSYIFLQLDIYWQ